MNWVLLMVSYVFEICFRALSKGDLYKNSLALLTFLSLFMLFYCFKSTELKLLTKGGSLFWVLLKSLKANGYSKFRLNFFYGVNYLLGLLMGNFLSVVACLFGNS